MLIKPKKISIGIRPMKGMFRIQSIGGLIVDELLDNLNSKGLSSEYFTIFQRGKDNSFVRLGREDSTASLQIDTGNLVFTVDHYEKATSPSSKEAVRDFKILFSLINKTLKMSGIRRIGMVAEYRIPENIHEASATLANNLLKLTPQGYPAKFNLSFEQRIPITTKIGMPDLTTDDFWNIIESYYDAEIDTEHSDPGAINFTVDVQRYYSPLLSDKVNDAIDGVLAKFEASEKNFIDRIKNLGFTDASGQKK